MVKSKDSDWLTVAFIRDELRRNQYSGDLFEALKYLLMKYDEQNTMLRAYTKPREYTVRMDVV